MEEAMNKFQNYTYHLVILKEITDAKNALDTVD